MQEQYHPLFTASARGWKVAVLSAKDSWNGRHGIVQSLGERSKRGKCASLLQVPPFQGSEAAALAVNKSMNKQPGAALCKGIRSSNMLPLDPMLITSSQLLEKEGELHYLSPKSSCPEYLRTWGVAVVPS